MKKIPIVLIFILAIVLLYYLNTLQNDTYFSGSIENHNAYIGSKIGGRVAKIYKKEGDSVHQGEVYNAKGKKQWSSPYQYDGYPYGDLTNDGQTFVYVNDTYFEDKAVVSIYHKGRYKQEIKGSAFKIVKSTIVSSTSSFMWLGDKRYQLTNDQLIIHTIDGQMFKIVIQDSITKPTN